ncbi:MAG: isochorismatase family protein [Halomonas sp.]|nr:N-carbamoylsarcosine amidohydrolase [Halomonas sp.]TVP49404.1 MAG: isochorismatase family protein [Halomonas sp.]
MTDSSLEKNYQQTFNGSTGFGNQPAILAIDFMKSYTTPSSGLYAEGVVEAVSHAQTLYATARQLGVPIIHTRVTYLASGENGGVFVEKLPILRDMTEDNPLTQFDEHVLPSADEAVICKQYPSAFFGTPLVSMLVKQGVDTVIITGCSTSGCVRASVVDAISYGFKVVVPRECVGDRHHAPHEANLFDIQAKYGDVMSTVDVMNYLKANHHG